MLIANPIYDAVFKYLLEDIEIAREFLSTILNEPISALSIKPQEATIQFEEGEIKIFHLDFKAVIDLPDGKQKNVLIELQKARKSYDIVRFRKYLGDNYIKAEIKTNEKGEKESYTTEIVTLYFLGFKLAGVDVPILKVGRKFINVVTQEEIKTDDDFITHLTHESYTIQIPRLKLNQQTELEQVLEVFNQENITDDLQRLEYIPKNKNPLVRKIVRRLSRAAADESIRHRMDTEDSFERIISRETSEKTKELLQVIEQRDNALEEKEKVINEKEKVIDELKRAEEEKEKELQDMKRELEEMKKRLGN